MIKKELFLVAFVILLYSFASAQNKYSIEGSLGVISPINSSAGLLVSGQLNYSVSEAVQLFSNAFYGSWDKYNVYYHYEYYTSEHPDTGPFKTFAADNHSLISINLGSRFILHENKIVNLLFDTQIGLSFLSFNKYRLNQVVNQETSQIDFVPDVSSPLKINETLLSFGVGPVFERKINSLFSLYISAKLNSMLNAGDNDFISKRGIYFLVSAGFTHMI
jgi:hypothetical protein